jgi:hypothetical protein
MFLDMIHHPVYIPKDNVSETVFCLLLQVTRTQLGPIDNVQERNICANAPRHKLYILVSPFILKLIYGMDWIQLAQDKNRWFGFLKMLENS